MESEKSIFVNESLFKKSQIEPMIPQRDSQTISYQCYRVKSKWISLRKQSRFKPKMNLNG